MVDNYAFSDNDALGWDSEGAWDFIDAPLINLAIGLIGSTLLMLLMMRFFSDLPVFNRLVMSKELNTGDSMDDGGISGEHLGLQGMTITGLRPAGKGEFDGKILDITAESGYIDSGEKVIVTDEDGVRILVEKI